MIYFRSGLFGICYITDLWHCETGVVLLWPCEFLQQVFIHQWLIFKLPLGKVLYVRLLLCTTAFGESCSTAMIVALHQGGWCISVTDINAPLSWILYALRYKQLPLRLPKKQWLASQLPLLRQAILSVLAQMASLIVLGILHQTSVFCHFSNVNLWRWRSHVSGVTSCFVYLNISAEYHGHISVSLPLSHGD